jgi:putative sterol carrier protein
MRISIWLKDVKSGQNFNINYYLEDKERENKDGTKKQYINQLGLCSWAADEDGLAQWFKGTPGNEKDFRVAYVGEEEFYEFLRNWLCELDYGKSDTTLSLDWKKLIRGNVREITSQINGEYCGNFVAMATITTKEKDGEVKEYQSVYNKAFLPAYSLKQFRLKENDYNDSSRVSSLLSKKSKDLRPHERFVIKIAGEYGCKDYYTFQDLHDYDPETNMVASNKVIANDDADY